MDVDAMPKPLVVWSSPTLIVYKSIWQPVTQPSSHVGNRSHLKTCSKLNVLKCAIYYLAASVPIISWGKLPQAKLTHLWKGGVIRKVMDVCELCQKKRHSLLNLLSRPHPETKFPVWSLLVAFVVLMLCLTHHGSWWLIEWQPRIGEGKILLFLLHSRAFLLSLLLIPHHFQHTSSHIYPTLLSLLSYTYLFLAPKPSMLINRTTEV